jgi:hypothetical protein
MRNSSRLGAVIAALGIFAACGEHPARGGAPTHPSDRPGPPPAQSSLDHHRNERLAQRLALALRRSEVRAALRDALTASPHPEGKVHFQWLALAEGGRLARELADAAGHRPTEVDQDLADAMSLEVYFPIEAHRDQWDGGPDLLVATAIRDGDTPVAFDPEGRRLLLHPDRPPTLPVLALVPAEHRYTGAYPTSAAIWEIWEGDNSQPPVGSSATTGLFMSYAEFVGTFESWFKGKPEFEVHMLGPSGPNTGTLTTLQCAGEQAGGPYWFDQNETTWSGQVLLFSQAQFDRFRSQYPGHALRILVLEDDDTACVIKHNSASLDRMIQAADALYRGRTSGRDTAFSIEKEYKNAKSLWSFITALASWIKTDDDIVGTAIEDVVVGTRWPRANWIVKAENNVTNGGIRLEMR